MIWFFVAIAGGLGAVFRFYSDTAISRKVGRRFPWGTACINVVGAFLGGVMLGYTRWGHDHATASAILLTGCLGGFTTASTFAAEIAGMTTEHHPTKALALSLLTAGVAVGLGGLGLMLGLAL